MSMFVSCRDKALCRADGERIVCNPSDAGFVGPNVINVIGNKYGYKNEKVAIESEPVKTDCKCEDKTFTICGYELSFIELLSAANVILNIIALIITIVIAKRCHCKC